MPTNHGWPAIFADGALAPPMTSFATSKALTRSVDATKAHACPCRLVPLSMVGSSLRRQQWTSNEGVHHRGEDEQELWKRSEGRGMSSWAYKGEDGSFLAELDRSIYVNVKLTTDGFQWEKTEPIWAQGSGGWPRSVTGRPNFAPKNSEFSPKIPL
jgi:hypothetical protein